MRGLLLGLGLLLSLTGVARAEEPSAADQAQVRAVIQSQMNAFRRDDAGAAFDLAAPAIQEMFGTAENFLGMVRNGYAPVYRPQEVDFRNAMMENGFLLQRVLVVGPDGRPVIALYTMEKQPDGTWRIAACRLLPTDERTT